MSDNNNKLQKGVDAFNTISQAGTQILQSVGTYIDANERRKFEQQLSILSISQQDKLAKEMASQQSEFERFKTLSEAITSLNNQRILNITSPQIEQEKNKRVQYTLIGIGLILGAGVIIYIISKSK
jgi:hypothetical protein